MNKKNGFTLIELIAAIAIIAIIAIIATPNILKMYKQSRIDAMVIQENKLVESGEILVEDYCKNPINDEKLSQCETYYKKLEEIASDEIIVKYICVSDLKDLGYYSEELKYSGNECQGVVIFEEDKETGLEVNSYTYVKCGTKYSSETNKEIDETLFENCFDTPVSVPNKEYTLTVKFTESSLNGPEVSQSITKQLKHNDTYSIDVPSYTANGNVYKYFIHSYSPKTSSEPIKNNSKITGVMPSNDLTINVVYSISKFKLIVNYLYFNPNGESTEKVFDTEETEVFTTEIAKVNVKKKDDYKIFYNGSESIPKEVVIGTNDEIVNLIYQKQTFNITYDNNGGIGCTTGKTTYNKSFGSLCLPNKTGYQFAGWYVYGELIPGTINKNTNTYNSDTNNKYYEDITLKAKWNPIVYEIEYLGGGATEGTMSKTECKYDENCKLLKNTFERNPGYTFNGWTDSNENTYTDEQSIKNLTTKNNETIILTAKWNPKTYPITLDGNGATTQETTSVTATYNRSLPEITKPEREYKVTFNANGGSVTQSSLTSKYTFNGYNYSGTQYYNSEGKSTNVWNIDSSATLIAQWTEKSITLPTPKRDGYTFTGWYTATSGGSKITSPYTPKKEITLYAHWREDVYEIFNVSNVSIGKQDTLANAISDASSGYTIKAIKNNTSGAVAINKNITLDTNGKTITMTGTLKNSATVTITGGGVIGSSTNIKTINNTGTLTLSNVSVNNKSNIALYNSSGATITIPTEYTGTSTGDTACNLYIESTSSYAIENLGTMTIGNASNVDDYDKKTTHACIISNTTYAIKNSGTMTYKTGSRSYSGSTEKPVYNSGTFNLQGGRIYYNNTSSSAFNNSGTLNKEGAWSSTTISATVTGKITSAKYQMYSYRKGGYQIVSSPVEGDILKTYNWQGSANGVWHYDQAQSYVGTTSSLFYVYYIEFKTPAFSSDKDITYRLDFGMKVVPSDTSKTIDSISLRYAVSESSTYKEKYKNRFSAVTTSEDPDQKASGEFKWENVKFSGQGTASSDRQYIYVPVEGLKPNTVYYLYIWPGSDLGTNKYLATIQANNYVTVHAYYKKYVE